MIPTAPRDFREVKNRTASLPSVPFSERNLLRFTVLASQSVSR